MTGSPSKPEPAAVQLVREFWARMASNRFATVADLLAPQYTLDWPQSNERICDPERFVAMNSGYPAHGPWRFEVHRVVGNDAEAVSDVSVTDGVQRGRAITFSTVSQGRIVRQVEFWPEPFAPAANRAHLVEPIS